jgi:ubiquinone/menaquinone biosynthesis C-methylase UbiE
MSIAETMGQAPYVDFRVGLPVRVRQALELVRGHRIDRALDIGCADSAFLGGLPASCRKVGLDMAPNRFRSADVQFVQSDVGGQALPFAAGSFDAVFAGEIIEHVLDTERFLREIHRVLTSRGMLVLTTPNLCSFRNVYHWARGQQLAWVDYRSGQYGHVRYFSPDSLGSLLRETGFAVQRMCSSGFEIGARFPWLAWLTPLTQRLFARSVRGNCLIVAATKDA